MMTPEQYVEGFKRLPCTCCKATNLMMLNAVSGSLGLFCKSCFETEETTIYEIKKRIETSGGLIQP